MIDIQKDFTWTDELVHEFTTSIQSDFNKGHSLKSSLEKFKKSKIKEPDEIRVSEIRYHTNNSVHGIIAFFTSQYDHSKLPSIKSAIEDILNEDNTGLPLPTDYIDMSEKELFVVDGNGKKFQLSDLYKNTQQKLIHLTKAQLDHIAEKSFNAARTVKFTEGQPIFNDHYRTIKSNFINCSVYKSFDDYYQSLL